MASIRRRKNSRFWYACITRPDGRQMQFSTGLTDPTEALAVATATEAAGGRHAGAPHRLRQTLERLASEFAPDNEHDPATWIVAWAAGRSREVAPATAKAYTLVAAETAEFLRANSIRSFASLSPAVLTRLRDRWAESAGNVTANHKIKILRSALAAAVRAKLLPENPATQLRSLRTATTRRREFRPAELATLLREVSGEWRTFVLLGLYTGQRSGDLAALRWANLDLEAAALTFTAKKTKRLVSLPLVGPALDAVLAMPAGEDPDALVFSHIGTLSAPARSSAFRRILANIGLADPAPRQPKPRKGALEAPPPSQLPSRRRTTSELSFHSLRHTATTLLKSAGVSDAIARGVIGHESPAVSRAYTHLDMATLRAALEKLPAVQP